MNYEELIRDLREQATPCANSGCIQTANDFCSYGERKKAQDKTCGTCKYFPPANKWPCVDCDMSIHDRWED